MSYSVLRDTRLGSFGKHHILAGPVLLILPLAFAPHVVAQPRTVHFSGYDWVVRQPGNGGPGPNAWDPANVSVDARGRLHLRISHARGEWRCAELYTTQRLGFGTYGFEVSGRVDRFDPNVVLGLFNYTEPDVGPDGSNEIDIEFAKWGNQAADNLNFTVYPSKPPRDNTEDHHTVTIRLNGDVSTHRFEWGPRSVAYRSIHGRVDDGRHELARWAFEPQEPRLIPQQPLPVHINLWLFRGRPPADGRSVEIVIDRFSFKPATGTR